MHTAPTSSQHRPHTSFARERDAQILQLLESHPATAEMLVERGLFTTKTRAQKRLRRLVERRQVRFAGTAWLKGGRPEHVYYRYRRPRIDALVHEVQLSRLCLRMQVDELRRGPEQVESAARPDAEFRIGGQRYLLEFDRGTMSFKQLVQTRFAKYRACPDVVLWVCQTLSRMEGLRKRAQLRGKTALFTTLDEAMVDPHGAIWIDVEGKRVSLPRSSMGTR